MEGVEIQLNPEVTASEVCDLRAAVGWDRQEEDYPAAFEGYWGTVGAFDSAKRLIGWGAILSDGVRHAILIDIIVGPSFQRRGLGSRIVAEAVAHVRHRGIELIHVDFVPDLAPFYERCGFRIGQGGIYDRQDPPPLVQRR